MILVCAVAYLICGMAVASAMIYWLRDDVARVCERRWLLIVLAWPLVIQWIFVCAILLFSFQTADCIRLRWYMRFTKKKEET